VRTLCALTDGPSLRAQGSWPHSRFAAAGGRPATELIEHVASAGHDRRYAIDYRKAAAEIGYAPTRDLARGLSETLEWYLSNRAWWEALLGRDYSVWMENNYGRR